MNIKFIQKNGGYTLEPRSFIEIWNTAKDIQEVQAVATSAWSVYRNNATVFPNSKGTICEPILSVISLARKARTFEKKGVYMKALPGQSGTRYNWDELKKFSNKFRE